jgi:hypothetical protein
MRGNLAYARGQVQYPPGPSGRAEADFWPAWLPRFSADVFLVLAGAAYVLGCAALTVWWLRRGVHSVLVGALCLAIAGMAGYGWHLLDADHLRNRQTPSVVIREDHVALRTGNGVSYPRHAELPTLRQGMEARRIHRRGAWLQVRFMSGEVGWIHADEALVVE